MLSYFYFLSIIFNEKKKKKKKKKKNDPTRHGARDASDQSVLGDVREGLRRLLELIKSRFQASFLDKYAK